MVFLLGSKLGVSLNHTFIRGQQELEDRKEKIANTDWMKEMELEQKVFVRYPTLFIVSIIVYKL